MTNDKTDRRVKYTKMVLRESLIKLLKEKPISRITIKELCEEADINRVTFYAHYHDQYDLLKMMEKDLLNDINSYLDRFTLLSSDADSVQTMTRIFEYIDQNARLCQVLFGKNGDIDFLDEIMLIVQDRLVLEGKSDGSIDQTTAEFIFVFAATGSIGLIQKWLTCEVKKTPMEMAALVISLTKRGLSAFV
jgi:AcrR family transcriptional regulator